jgi:hypothetical protein
MSPDREHGFSTVRAGNDAAMERVELGTTYRSRAIGDLGGSWFGSVSIPQRILSIADECP